MDAVPPSARPRRRRWILWLLLLGPLTVVALLLLAVLAFALQGRVEWARTKADLLAAGEKLTLSGLAPPPVTDADNFFAAPLWEEVIAAKGRIEETRLRAAAEPVPAAALEALQKRFPGLEIPAPSPPTTVVGAIDRLAKKSPDEALRRELAAESLALLAPLRPLTDEIEALLARPAARFPVAYDEAAGYPTLPHIRPLLTVSRLFSQRVRAELFLGERHAAFADTTAVFRLADTVRSEPFLLSVLVRTALLKIGDDLIREGIQRHEWSEAELAAFADRLSRVDLVDHQARALRGEATGMIRLMEASDPKPFLEALDLGLALASGKSAEPASSPAAREMAVRAYLFACGHRELVFYQRVLHDRARALDESPARALDPARFSIPELTEGGAFWRATHAMSAVIVETTLANDVPRILHRQNALEQTRIACALERYRLAHGRYPASLADLVPAYLATTPRDVFGRNFHYERTGDAFRLWSDGWDRQDAKGEVAARRSDYRTADWTWDLAPGETPTAP